LNRDQIVEEIQRLAAKADGVPPGVRKFASETGYRWRDGTYWARWNDAVREAGFEPNTRRQPHTEEHLLEHVAQLSMELGRFPNLSDLNLRRREDPTFPSPDSIQRRFRPWANLIQRVAEYTADRDDLAEAHRLCIERLEAEAPSPDVATPRRGGAEQDEFVYLMKSGANYKIGRSNSVGRRHYELGIQLPDALDVVHTIRTDDGVGIERYWHARFADRHTNGEWYKLAAADVRAFKRRQFM
jgi:hypothetical protein